MAEDVLFDLLHTEIVNLLYDSAATNNEQVFVWFSLHDVGMLRAKFNRDTPTLTVYANETVTALLKLEHLKISCVRLWTSDYQKSSNSWKYHCFLRHDKIKLRKLGASFGSKQLII